jgi:DNA-binding NarL/FixJ family response regulator
MLRGKRLPRGGDPLAARAATYRKNTVLHILIADDHALVREGLVHTLGALAPEARFLEAENADEVRSQTAAGHVLDLVLLDLFMPGAGEFSLLSELCRSDPDLPVVVLSGSTDPAHMRKALDLGASGFIPKSSTGDVMLSALRLVLAGGIYVPPDMLKPPGGQSAPVTPQAPGTARAPATAAAAAAGLTERQLDVLACLVDGKSNKQIARDLVVSENTVKIHVAAILRALGVNNRTQAAVAARKLGLLQGS